MPFWYWAAAGAGIGYAVFAFASLVPVLMSIAVLVVALGTRPLSLVLVRTSGVRFRQIVGESASWLKIAFLVVVVLALVIAMTLDRAAGSRWPGSAAGALAFLATLAFGRGYNWLLRHGPVA